MPFSTDPPPVSQAGRSWEEEEPLWWEEEVLWVSWKVRSRLSPEPAWGDEDLTGNMVGLS